MQNSIGSIKSIHGIVGRHNKYPEIVCISRIVDPFRENELSIGSWFRHNAKYDSPRQSAHNRPSCANEIEAREPTAPVVSVNKLMRDVGRKPWVSSRVPDDEYLRMLQVNGKGPQQESSVNKICHPWLQEIVSDIPQASSSFLTHMPQDVGMCVFDERPNQLGTIECT